MLSVVLCLCNFDSWCGESRGQSRILPVGLGREPQSQTVIKHSTFSFYLQIECKNNSPRWHLSQNRWQLPAQSLSHTYIFKIHTPIYTHTHFRTRLCPPKTSSVIRAHTHTHLKTDACFLGFLFLLVSKVLHQPCPVWKCLSQNNVRSSGLSVEYAKSWCSFEAWRNLVVCGYVVLFICSMFYEK